MGFICYMSGEVSAVISMYLIRQSAFESRILHPVIIIATLDGMKSSSGFLIALGFSYSRLK